MHDLHAPLARSVRCARRAVSAFPATDQFDGRASMARNETPVTLRPHQRGRSWAIKRPISQRSGSQRRERGRWPAIFGPVGSRAASRGGDWRRDVARRTDPAELISRGVRLAVIETLGVRYHTPEIDRLFKSEGWRVDLDGLDRFEDTAQGRAEAFDRVVDFTSPGDAEAYLVVVGHLLARLAQGEAEEKWDDKKAPYRTGRERIERELRRAGCAPENEGTWHLPVRVEPSATMLEAAEGTGLARIVAAMRRPDCDPEERIGLAKELVEGTIKVALDGLDETYGENDDIPALSKRLHRRLNLDQALTLAPDPKGEEAARRLLIATTEIPHHLGTLRNSLGGGHGRADKIGGIAALADFAARVADAYATYIVDLLKRRVSS